MMRVFASSSVLLLFSLTNAIVQAQGLLWQLPEDGTAAIYSGTYRQENLAADPMVQPEVVVWERQLTLKSVGTIQRFFQGEQVDCRWIEFVLINAVETGQGADPTGPSSRRICKVLIPEPAIGVEFEDGIPQDEEGILKAYLPILAGKMQSGAKVNLGLNLPNQNPPNPLQNNPNSIDLTTTYSLEPSYFYPLEPAPFQAYPLLTLLTYYREHNISEQMETVSTAHGDLQARRITAKQVIESRDTRVTNTATLWKNDDSTVSPFGLVSWEVTVVRETKTISDPRSTFRVVSRTTETMELQEIQQNATSELE